ncbi:fumarylacetoacetase [Pseudahrensia aquimaris]|uniref:fumarylacetoacetase n=1 Tax=Pseudahrensia aquimaris TaxID=744461 RepID=A0ABW3FHA8_9HYPH
MTKLTRSWVESANSANHPFPLNNLPYGVFSTAKEDARCGVAIGNEILDVRALEEAGIVSFGGAFAHPTWNDFMALGSAEWSRLRQELTALLSEASTQANTLRPHLVSQKDATLHMPFNVAEFTDFYAGRNHAVNVGTMFRGAENALPPNWLHIPIGYNGRASSVVVSGTPVHRPWGQLKGPNDETPRFAPCERFDLELEIGAIVGTPSNNPLSVDEADAAIFGYVLLNDWSARDIQAWEYQPLGPFQSKATATTISPWIVTKAALEHFRIDTPPREVALLDHLKDTGPMLYDIDLAVSLAPQGQKTSVLSHTNMRELYYSAAQQLAHHSSSGCPMRTGDLLGSGTISGSEKHEFGSLLEMSWGGKEPVTLDNGETRTFLQDGDTLTLTGKARGDGYTIGFGDCVGTILPAHERKD